ncbi:hypothetical protein GcM3_05926 [Golovinomyces cichoracearum]|uniref:Secreted effector protein n=1 Tax=Golovinomyces cichoracearum TaxID=62708 RepID=A0A420I940_9PEZI|nr:hypothetical protein GcM3_05926 [Golovinomyces cichoracearum]
MQISTYFITLSLLSPLVSGALEPKYKSLFSNRVPASVTCNDETTFPHDELKREATNACSKIDHKFNCSFKMGCFKPGFSIKTSTLKVYRGKFFKNRGITNAKLPNFHLSHTYYQYQLPKGTSIRHRYLNPDSDKCTYEGMVMILGHRESKCNSESNTPGNKGDTFLGDSGDSERGPLLGSID